MDSFIKDCKTMIDKDNLEGLQEYIQENLDENYAWEYAYQKIYLHACLKKRTTIVEWLKTLYDLMDPIQKVALRQMFSYGNYLLTKV